MRPPLESAWGLGAVLRGVVADMQHASKADIVSIFLYEESTHTYFAPFATGQVTNYTIGTRPAFDAGARHTVAAPGRDGRDPRATPQSVTDGATS